MQLTVRIEKVGQSTVLELRPIVRIPDSGIDNVETNHTVPMD